MGDAPPYKVPYLAIRFPRLAPIAFRFTVVTLAVGDTAQIVQHPTFTPLVSQLTIDRQRLRIGAPGVSELPLRYFQHSQPSQAVRFQLPQACSTLHLQGSLQLLLTCIVLPLLRQRLSSLEQPRITTRGNGKQKHRRVLEDSFPLARLGAVVC